MIRPANTNAAASVTYDAADFDRRFPGATAFLHREAGTVTNMEVVGMHACFEALVTRRGGDRSADVALWGRILCAVRTGTVEALVAAEGGAA